MTFESFDRDEARYDRLVENGGFPPERARQITQGTVRPLGEIAVQEKNHIERTRYSHRGGRAYPEPSDSELDPHWTGPIETVDDEQARINHKGASLAHAVGRFVELEDIKYLPKEEKQRQIDAFIAAYMDQSNE